ncbi:MAG: HAD hydrolase-like protein [Clostridia bacterium]|nr:HAD hydrolase-like protein [Clostridia bacterium]
MKYRYVLFDLDGTLTESAPGITNAAAYALKAFGVDAKPSELEFFVGPPLLGSFMRCGLTEAQAREAIDVYRDYYVARGMFENTPYDGVEDMLRRLREAGAELIVATSKPEPFSVQILERFGLAGYFSVIAGSTLDETRTEKPDVIEYALASAGVTDRSAAIMVGDRSYDVDGAKATGLDAMGVLYGYGSAEEFKEAEYVASSPSEVADILLRAS